ncbi:MAG: acyltransferase family protein [Flavobacteriaceae bacterium]
MQTTKIRRYDLDWLRVLVFGLLIIYHVGMFFVPWGWHIKNNEISEELVWPMAFVNRWRLHILFVISGIGTFYALSFRSAGQFAWERIKRLGIPLLFGMLFIIPPQVYIERLAHGEISTGYLTYFTTQAFDGVYPQGNLSWHHLWFLPYLLIYSLILMPVFIYLRSHPQNPFTSWVSRLLQKPWKIYLFVIPLYFVEALVEPFFPVTHALIDDWFTFVNFLILFFYGFVLISAREAFWTALRKIKRPALIIGILCFSVQLYLWSIEDTIIRHFSEALIAVLNFWSWILVIFGYGAKYLNRKSKILAYCNRAVYPFYILHQTVTIVIAYYLMNLSWSIWLKFIILTGGTFLVCWLLYELFILRIPLLHPVFGLKKQNKAVVEGAPKKAIS